MTMTKTQQASLKHDRKMRPNAFLKRRDANNRRVRAWARREFGDDYMVALGYHGGLADHFSPSRAFKQLTGQPTGLGTPLHLLRKVQR